MSQYNDPCIEDYDYYYQNHWEAIVEDFLEKEPEFYEYFVEKYPNYKLEQSYTDELISDFEKWIVNSEYFEAFDKFCTDSWHDYVAGASERLADIQYDQRVDDSLDR